MPRQSNPDAVALSFMFDFELSDGCKSAFSLQSSVFCFSTVVVMCDVVTYVCAVSVECDDNETDERNDE